MPESTASINLKAPFRAVEEIMSSLAADLGYRCEADQMGNLKGIKKVDSQILRARKNLVYELKISWHDEDEKTHEEDHDDSTWGLKTIDVTVIEQMASWTLGKCKEEIQAFVAGAQQAYEKWRESNTRWLHDKRYGGARWAATGELIKSNYLAHEPPKNGLVIGPLGSSENDYRVLCVPPEERVRHTLICGPTGCGKTSALFVPNLLLDVASSAIISEATPGGIIPDLYAKTSGYRKAHGHEVFYFNPQDLRSHRVNPIDRVKTVSQAQDLADLIIRNTTANTHMGDQVWETAERQLLTALIMMAAVEEGNLASVRKMLNQGQKQLIKYVASGPKDVGREECLAMFNLSSEGFLNGVMVGLMVRLSPWLNPIVQAVTETTDFDVEILKQELFSFYLAVPAGKRQMKPVAAVVLNYLLDTILDANRDQDVQPKPVCMMLDELTNFGYLPDLPSQLTILRHAGIPIVLGIQDLEQLKKVYGFEDAKIIVSQPATRIFFRPNELTTARLVSDQLGQETKRDFVPHRGPRFYGRKLMSPDEVLDLPPKQVICFTGSTRPIKFQKIDPSIFDEIIESHPPTMREPLVVSNSLLDSQGPAKEMMDAAKRSYPRLFREPVNKAEEDALLLKQNEIRKSRVPPDALKRLMDDEQEF